MGFKIKIKKQYIFLGIFIIIIIATGFILTRFVVLSEYSPPVSPDLMIKPAYLSQKIPTIDKMKTVVDNPKFKEMLYIKAFFTPITTVEKGRPNPFAPFIVEQE